MNKKFPYSFFKEANFVEEIKESLETQLTKILKEHSGLVRKLSKKEKMAKAS